MNRACNEETCNESFEWKRSRYTKASLGNGSMNSRTKVTRDASPFMLSTDEVIQRFSDINSNCTCRKRHQNQGGCLYENCERNHERANATIVACKMRFANLNKAEIRTKQAEILRSVLPADLERLEVKESIFCDWKIDGKPVCRNTFIALYDISDHYARDFMKKVKLSRSQDVNPQTIRSYTDDQVFDFSWNEMEQEVFGKNITDGGVESDWVRSAGTSVSDDQIFCSIWLKEYFELCDQSPTSRCTFVNVSEKSEVYKLYKNNMQSSGRDVLAQNTFLDMWAKLYPFSVKRPRCEILGKCGTCYEIDQIRKCSEGKIMQEMCKQAHAIHRGGMFMLERISYKTRVHKALVSLATGRPNIMSIIIDGMDQSSCTIPHLGSQDTFGNPLKQGITGVKEHGVGVTLYRTVNTVRKGANLTIYCITKQLENFYDRHKCYPDELYIQADGGAENANKYVLAALELLVVKRVVKKIVFSRLPTGHTHEDIDACFGTINNAIAAFKKHIPTLDAYKNLVEEAFSDSKLECKFIDVMMIPDYQEILSSCVDPKLEHLHKTVDTQHQWLFEAVEPCLFFPLGCRTAYRAYCSDTVVEFVKKCKDLCQSKIGRYIGLEPITVHCRWYPSADCDPGTRKGVEGFYLLHAVPDFKLTEDLPHHAMSGSAPEKMRNTKNEILRRYGLSNTVDSEIRKQWINWFEIYLPLTSDTADYVKQLKKHKRMYSVPLRHILFCKRRILTRDLKEFSELDWLNNDTIEWPKVECFAMPSVSSSFNDNPPPPRLYRQVDETWTASVQSFNDTTSEYYAGVLPSISTVASLKHCLRNTLSYSCSIPAVSDVKLRLLNKLQQINKDFYSTVHRSLLGADIEYINYKMSADDDTTEIAKVGTLSVARSTFRNLMPAQPWSIDLMRVVLSLFKDRTSRIRSTYKELYETEPNPKPPVEFSVFFESVEEAEANLLPLITDKMVQAYILCRDDSGSWCLFLFDVKNFILYTIR